MDVTGCLPDFPLCFVFKMSSSRHRGLIRGASYRSRSKRQYDPSADDDRSPYQSDSDKRHFYDSDGYGAEYDDEKLSESSASRVTPALIRDHVPPSKLATAKNASPMTLDGVAKRTSPGSLDLVLSGPRYGAATGCHDRRKRTAGRSDGDDSPLSSSPSSSEEFDKNLKETSTPRLPKPRESSIRLSQHIRQNSYYDNNNNSSSSGSKSPGSPQKDPAAAARPNRLPDIEQIVDTVTAVRSRGNSSDPASGSSASSTLAKSRPLLVADKAEQKETLDEKEEWEQITSIMSSIGGGLNRDPVYTKEFEETFWKIMTGSELPRQVSTWLSELGLPQYEKVLCGNGFDDVDFMAGEILEEQDLIDMDIKDASHRRRLLESAKNLPRSHPLPPADDPSAPSSVGEWLESLHLSQYEGALLSAGFDVMSFVRLMTELEIKPLVGKRGHFKRVKASLLSRGGEEHKPGSNRSTRSRQGSQVTKASPPLSRSPLLDSANFFKDYNSIVKSRNTTLSSTKSGGHSSPAFPSGTVSSTGSGSSADCQQGPRSAAPKSKDEALTSSAYQVPKEPAEKIATTTTTSSSIPERSSSTRSSRNHHGHRRKSSRDNDSARPRSRSGSHSSRTRRTELSVFVDKGVQKEQKTSRSSQRHRSHHKSSSSIRSVDSEQKENLRMSGKSNSFDIPDLQRAIFLASESSPGGKAGGLNLRPPNEATAEVSVHAWRHTADTLITTTCNYQAYYLGSMLIQELKGVESTMEACAKMRRSTDSMKKIPTIMLAINYTGVKFIDSKSKHEIAEHEICNISFASQDSEDLSTFAYITHDVRTGHHYCHVFRVTTMDMAYEIILTLGQAFEVAYQLILKDKALKEGESR